MPSFLIRGVLVWHLVVSNFVAQPSQVVQQKKPPVLTAKTTPRLSPRQKKGLEMLQAAEAGAQVLPAPMRAYLLLQIASSYQGIDPLRERRLRLQAFQASLSIEGNDDKEQVQDEILRELLNTSPVDLERAITKAMPWVRNQYAAELSSKYAQSKHYDRALELLHQVAAETEFPYQAAASLMLYLPEDRALDRQNIFYEALAAYETSDTPELPQFEDMATLVIRFWDKLPPVLILEATDRILDRAKDETHEGANQQVAISSRAGAASFASMYELRLFQLLPVLRKLDESKAEQLLREAPRVEGLLKQYPAGMQSFDVTLNGTPTKKRQHSGMISVSVGDQYSGFDSSAHLVWEEIEKQRAAIYQLARNDPKEAVKRAKSMPGDPVQRGQTLINAGNLIGKRDPAEARIALQEGVKLSTKSEAVFRFGNLKDAVEGFLEIGDQESALKTIDEGIKLAEEIYAQDTDSSHPNLAIKAQWPSTNVWCQFVGLATRISLQEAAKIVDQVSDPEIRTFLRVAMASSLVGEEPRRLQSIRRTQEGIKEVW